MRSSLDPDPRRDPPETVVRRVVEPGERIVWAGRPDLDALTAEARRMTSGRTLTGQIVRYGLVAAVGLGLITYLNGSDPMSTLALLILALQAQPLQALMAGTALVAVPTLIVWLHRRSARSFMRRAARLTYAITDRRLLILLDDRIEDEFSPEDARTVGIRERTPGYGDVVLAYGTGSGSRGESLMSRERRTRGFKALPDAEGIQHLIDEWREAHFTASERQVEDFLADHVSLSSAGDDPGVDAADEADEKRIVGGRHGLTVTVPVEWDVKVRSRGQPFGRITLDMVRWRELSELADWNVVQVDGPFGTAVEIHVDAVSEPTLEYQGTVESKLGGLMSGQVVESRPDLRRGRFQGWSVTRRHEALADPSRPDLDQPGFSRMTLLHDGVVQLAFQSRWPAGTESMARVVGKIEESVSARSDGVTPDAAGAGLPGGAFSGALGVARALATVGRVLLGLFFLGIGVWAGYDQTRRAEAYDAALGTLTEAGAQGLPVLPADRVVEEHDGELAYLQGPLEAPIVTDTLTGLSVETWRLVRTVELFQWRETETTERTTSSSTPTRSYSYERVWSSDLIDSDDFATPLVGGTRRVNPDSKPYPDEIFISGDLRLGAWRLPPLTWGRPQREAVPDSLLGAAASSDPRWSVDGGYLYDADVPDVRVAYTYHPVPRDTYSLVGIPRDGEVDLDGAMVEVSLLLRGSVPADDIVASVAGTSRGVSLLWLAYGWIGLMLLIRPVTKRLELFRFLTDAPFPKRVAMTAGIAAAVMLVLALWFG